MYRFNNIFLSDTNLAKRGIINVKIMALNIDNITLNLPNAPICAKEVVLPKIEISHIVICPETQ